MAESLIDKEDHAAHDDDDQESHETEVIVGRASYFLVSAHPSLVLPWSIDVLRVSVRVHWSLSIIDDGALKICEDSLMPACHLLYPLVFPKRCR